LKAFIAARDEEKVTHHPFGLSNSEVSRSLCHQVSQCLTRLAVITSDEVPIAAIDSANLATDLPRGEKNTLSGRVAVAWSLYLIGVENKAVEVARCARP
jgi:hypothetical protein